MFGFFQAEGDFAIERKTATVTLGDGTTANVALLTIGASGLDAFAGIHGGTVDAVGCRLSGRFTAGPVHCGILPNADGTFAWFNGDEEGTAASFREA